MPANKIPEVPIEARIYLTIPEAAGLSGLTDRQIYGMINNAEIRPAWAVKVGARLMIKRAPFVDYLNAASEIKRYK